MDNTASWGYDLEIVEGSGAPFQEFESLVVSFEFNFFVLFPCISDSGHISLNTVVYNQINWAERIDLFWITSEPDHSISHGCQINYSRYTSKILENDSCWFEWDFDLLFGFLLPVEDVFNIAGFDFELVAVSDGTFQKDSDTVWESFKSRVVEGREVVIS
jgi:hypothetical protein